MKIKKKGNYLEIAGKLYKVKGVDGKKDFEDMEFEPVKKNIESKIVKISNKISGAINANEILQNALYDLSEKQIDILYKKVINQKTKPKMKKRYGCFELSVGGVKIPIRN